MDIKVEQHEPWTVLVLCGDLDQESGPGVYLQFQRELLAGRTRFLIDLGRVGFVDSAGLSVLVRCYRDARGRGGEVALNHIPGPIERILEFTRLDSIFRIAELAGAAEAGAGDDPDLKAA